MFLASAATAAVLVIGAAIGEDARLRKALAPAVLGQAFEHALRASAPLPVQEGLPRSWCRDALHVLSERIMTGAMGDRTGDNNANGFGMAVDAGRLAVSLSTPDASGCTFSSEAVGVDAALRQRMEAAAGSARGPGGGKVVEQPDGWISVARVAPDGKDRLILTVGVRILSPFAKLMQPRSVFRPMAVFILTINALSALVLVILLIGRIRKANQAAAAWASGELGKRIDDPGQDEFSRLAHRFDVMADAMAGVIAVKQALAAAEERNRVARDLHDSAKQRAFALNLQLSAAQSKVPPESEGGRIVDAALSLTNQLQQDLANVIRRLAAPTITESGFRRVMTEAVEAMLAGSRLRWSVALDDRDEAMFSARPEIARQVFLITVEAVANALKHSGGTSCAISGARTGTLYTWRIADDGSGLLPAASRGKGMGLANMKLRADELPEGTLDILPCDGGGTVILVTFLVEKPDPE